MTATSIALVDLPVRDFLRMQQHHDDMLREFALIAVGTGDSQQDTSVPRRLLELVGETRDRFGGMSLQFRSAVQAAYARGDEVTTLTLQLEPETLRWAEDLLMLFEEADEFCRAGQLLTPPSPPRVAAVRRWVVGELIRQLRDNAAPSPYAGPA